MIECRLAGRQGDRQAGMLQLTIAGFCDCEGQVESPDSQSQGCSKTEGDACGKQFGHCSGRLTLTGEDFACKACLCFCASVQPDGSSMLCHAHSRKHCSGS